ncbi:MAG TPA: hypothetical protein VMR74_02040 [Gammaproteobacteria bacterium]|nr:hypothetical protein [Gammaproteobacteria bacterium]
MLVQDARWLIPLAQSPTTDELGAYFDVAQRVAETLPEQDRLEVLKAHVQMIAGHLRSQIRHYCTKDGVSLDDDSVVLRTRTSNALDFALLVEGLVALLEAYQRARQDGDGRKRLELAGAICQGISPDPELFLNRLDLLGPYSIIEHLFIATDRDGRVAYTPMGRRHLQLYRGYEALIGRLAESLHEECPRFRPAEGACSPYGIIFGTPTNLTEDMAFRTLQPDAVSRFKVEDVFADGDTDPDKLAWVNGWRKLPHVDREVQKLYEYPHQFAEDVFARVEHALRRRVADGGSSDEARTGRLFIVAEDDAGGDSNAASIPDLPVRYIASSDSQIVADRKADPYDETRLLRDRQEGYFVLSYETAGGWLAVRKDFLTEVLGKGQDAKLVGLPPAAAAVLSLMCPKLVIRRNLPDQASMPPSILNA